MLSVNKALRFNWGWIMWLHSYSFKDLRTEKCGDRFVAIVWHGRASNYDLSLHSLDLKDSTNY